MPPSSPGPGRVAVVVRAGRIGLVGDGIAAVLPVSEAAGRVAALEATATPRWVWWSAAESAAPLAAAGVRPARAWDIAEAHRLLHGGWRADPGSAWAGAHRLSLDAVPSPPTGDLFDVGADDTPGLVRPDGHLRPDAVTGDWLSSDDRLLAWARAALACAERQREQACATTRLETTIYAESAAAMLAVELGLDGLPVDRAALLALVEPLSGPRADRDTSVLTLVPGREHTDLRNPAQVRALLAAVGIDVPSTRKHVLEAFVDVHPVVPALLRWRRSERIATTYGLRWIEERVGPDDRLRGVWTACDGAGGRMTADGGLHNLPAALRPGVAAHPGHLLVRADLGQVEPRVLAAVSGDRAFAAATAADDLYAPVAGRLGVDRAVAKIAVLAAMYGQRTGAAGEALRGLERAYPTAMRYLDAAYDVGVRAGTLRTFGGRLLVTGSTFGGAPAGADRALDAARGRFARNAVIQGAAAELFKAWAATVRAAIRPLGARIVLCLHDELLVHAPQERAGEVAAVVDTALTDAARRWCGGAPVRFVADTSVISRWSEAKG